MVQRNRFYRVKVKPSMLIRSYPLQEVRSGTIVKALEGAPKGSLDVVDVQLSSGKVKSVYSFQLDKPIKKPKNW